MANIKSFLDQIGNARYGKEVRSSIVNAIDAVNKESEASVEKVSKAEANVNKVVADSSAATEAANKATQSATTAANNANEAAKAIFDEKYILTTRTEFAKSTSVSPTAKGNAILEKLGGDSWQDTLSGKNLLQNTATTTTSNGVMFTKNRDGSITVSGTATANTYFQVGTFVPTIGESYILSGGVANCSNSTRMLYWNTSNATVIDSGKGATISVADNTTKDNVVSLFVASGQAINETFYPMITLASEADQTYEPYCGGASPNSNYPQEIKSVDNVTIKVQNKNLFNSSDVTDGYATNKSGGLYAESTYSASGYIEVVAGETYATTNIKWLNVYDREKKHLQQIGSSDVAVFAVPEEGAYVRLSMVTTNKGAAQLECGSEATDYIPHAEHEITIPLSEPLRGIGDVKDEICVQDGVYGILRRIAEIVLNGSETWKRYGSVGNDSSYFYTAIGGYGDVKTGSILSTHYLKTTVSSNTNSVGIYITNSSASNQAQIHIRPDMLDITASEFASMLQANPITAQYGLKTPVFEPFEDQMPFYNLMAYDEVTHVSIVGCHEELNPMVTMRFPRNEDGAMVTTNWCDNRKNEIAMNELKVALMELGRL